MMMNDDDDDDDDNVIIIIIILQNIHNGHSLTHPWGWSKVTVVSEFKVWSTSYTCHCQIACNIVLKKFHCNKMVVRLFIHYKDLYSLTAISSL